MLQRFLSFTITVLLCLGSSTAFAQTDPSETDPLLAEAPTLEEHRATAAWLSIALFVLAFLLALRRGR